MAGFLTVREAAAIARCEHKAVRRAVASGRLPAFQPAHKLLVREEDVYRWIEDRPVSPRLTPDAASGSRRPRAGMQSNGPGSVSNLREIERKAARP